MRRLRRDADRICARFGLRYRAIDAERANVKRRYGICYDDGSIKIRLRHVATGKPLKYSSLVNTLCHELAHLKHFNHGPQFQTFNARILSWARREGLYRPGPTRAVAAAGRPVGHGPRVLDSVAPREPASFSSSSAGWGGHPPQLDAQRETKRSEDARRLAPPAKASLRLLRRWRGLR